MSSRPQIALVTSRDSFEAAWRPLLAGLGLGATLLPPQAQGPITAHALVLDAGSSEFAEEEDELLAWAGTAAARGRPCVAVAPSDAERKRLASSVLLDVCHGLIVGPGDDEAHVAASALARRVDPTAMRRFEYVTLAPDGPELLAISGAGTSRLLSRPLDDGDAGGAVSTIEFDADFRTVTVSVEEGASFSVEAAKVFGSSVAGNGAPEPGSPAAETTLPIDGVTLGRRMRELRMQAGLTQAELARRTGIHRPNIARVEAGRHTPSLETVARIAQAIGVSPTRVLSGS